MLHFFGLGGGRKDGKNAHLTVTIPSTKVDLPEKEEQKENGKPSAKAKKQGKKNGKKNGTPQRQPLMFQLDVETKNVEKRYADKQGQARLWTLYKDANSFFTLRDKLKPHYPSLPPIKFARSQRSPRSGKKNAMDMEAPFVAQMRHTLDRWMKAVVEHNEVREERQEIAEFLELQQHTSAGRPKGSKKGGMYGSRGMSGKPGLEDFVLLKVIGKGSFGKVLQVKTQDTGEILAMKILKKQHIIKRNQVEHTKTERNVLEKLEHPFIVTLRYAFQTDKKLYLVLDYCSGGELFFHLGKAGKFPESRARFYAAEIVLALEYLHSQDIIYRDLKPENILLDSEGHVKLTDFGLSKEGVKDNSSAHSFCGTPEYLAPEILRRAGHGKGADWWSLGALLYEMLTGMPPFYSRDRDRLFEKILHSELRFPMYFSKPARQILSQLMNRNPKRRLGTVQGASEIRRHTFFANVDWEAMYKRDVEVPFKPSLKQDRNGVEGTGNFDPEFTGMPIYSPDATRGRYAKFKDFTYVRPRHLNEKEDAAFADNTDDEET